MRKKKKKKQREIRKIEGKNNGDLRDCWEFLLFHSLGLAIVLLRLNMFFVSILLRLLFGG